MKAPTGFEDVIDDDEYGPLSPDPSAHVSLPDLWVPETDITWRTRAACIGTSKDFHNIAKAHKAKEVCAQCPVVEPCLRFALNNRIGYGVYGGTTPDERKAMY